MNQYHAKLGIALDHVDGPLTHAENGQPILPRGIA